MPLQADADLQVLLLGFFGRGQHAAHAGRIGGHRLLHEHVLAGVHGVLEVLRPKARRSGEQHDIDPAVDRFAIGIEPEELPLLGYVERGVVRSAVFRRSSGQSEGSPPADLRRHPPWPTA